MSKIVEDLNAITDIPIFTQERIIEKIEDCICFSFKEKLLNGEMVDNIDIGIGTLSLKLEGNELRYRFIPSKHLEKVLINTVNGDDALTIQAEKSLKDRIKYTYKEIF